METKQTHPIEAFDNLSFDGHGLACLVAAVWLEVNRDLREWAGRGRER